MEVLNKTVASFLHWIRGDFQGKSPALRQQQGLECSVKVGTAAKMSCVQSMGEWVIEMVPRACDEAESTVTLWMRGLCWPSAPSVCSLLFGALLGNRQWVRGVEWEYTAGSRISIKCKREKAQNHFAKSITWPLWVQIYFFLFKTWVLLWTVHVVKFQHIVRTQTFSLTSGICQHRIFNLKPAKFLV